MLAYVASCLYKARCSGRSSPKCKLNWLTAVCCYNWLCVHYGGLECTRGAYESGHDLTQMRIPVSHWSARRSSSTGAQVCNASVITSRQQSAPGTPVTLQSITLLLSVLYKDQRTFSNSNTKEIRSLAVADKPLSFGLLHKIRRKTLPSCYWCTH